MVPAGVDIYLIQHPPPANCSLQGSSILTESASSGTPTTQEAITTGGSFIRDAPPGFRLIALSFSPHPGILASWHPGTRVQYNSLLRGWQGFCSQQQVHPLSPTILDVIAYLTSMYDPRPSVYDYCCH